MKHIRGYRHYHKNKYSEHYTDRSVIGKIIEKNYSEFISKTKSNTHYADIGKKDSRSIFEIALSDSEYQFLKENMSIEDINSVLIESISITINACNSDVINEGILDGIKKKISDSVDKAINWVGDKVDKAVEFGKVAVKKMKDIITNITDIVSNLYKQVKSSLGQMWAFLGQQFSKLTEKMKGGLKKAGNAKTKALVSLLEADNMSKETEEAKKDFSKIKQMITGGRLADQADVETKMADKAEDFKDYSADELEKTVVDDVTAVTQESLINSLKGLIIENGTSILDELSESLNKDSNIDKIYEKDGVSSKSIFSWVLEGVSVIISWKSKLIEKLTKIGTNFMMNFMSNIARAGSGVKYVLMGQVVAFIFALIYEMMHLAHEIEDLNSVSKGATAALESKLNEAEAPEKETPEAENKEIEKNTAENTEDVKKEVKPEEKEEAEDKKEDTGKVKEIVKNLNMNSLSPDKLISAIDWKALKFTGLSIVFVLAIKVLLPQLSLLFTIVGVCICSFELIESVCTLTKSHSGVCKAIHNIEHFANGLFTAQKPAAAH